MKISYRTHPVLKYLGANDAIPIPDINNEFLLKPIFKEWELLRNNFNKNINIISSTFATAAMLAKDKLKLQEVFYSLGDISGTVIFGTYCICYEAKVGVDKDGKKGYKIDLFLFSFGNMILAYNNNVEYAADFFGIKSTNDNAEMLGLVWNWFQVAQSFLLLKKYAQVETKYLPAKKTTTDINCKYVNETNSNITILDSKWFTTLVKSDAFKVRGHFRLQPKKKDGEWTKELIWINDFTKDGYTAPAKCLNIL